MAANSTAYVRRFSTGVLRKVAEQSLGNPSDKNHWQQLEAIETHLDQLGCSAITVETHYIDRDYMEDYSVFYSKCLHPYPNFCSRVHFFRGLSAQQIRPQLEDLQEKARENVLESRVADYLRACKDFSAECYLGFLVLRPLLGSPVGRTILKRRGDDQVLVAPRATSHLLGVELTVSGVPFQQQDVGVSACATTALWASLLVSAGQEAMSPATPAQITTLASKYSLPFGRAMPSPGLSVGQMSQAVEALGLSASLLRADFFEDARGYIHTALRSEAAPVLVLEDPGTEDGHAVVAVGMTKAESSKESLKYLPNIGDNADALKTIHVHDDRTGPYLPCRLIQKNSLAYLEIPRHPRPELWRISQILLPSPPKIRLSLGEMRQISLELCTLTQRLSISSGSSPLRFEAFVRRSHTYIQELLLDSSTSAAKVRKRLQALKLPRYLGVVRLFKAGREPIDVLIDTTSTPRNLHYVDVIALGIASEETQELATDILAEFRRHNLVGVH